MTGSRWIRGIAATVLSVTNKGVPGTLPTDAAEAIAGHDRVVHGRTGFDPGRDVHVAGGGLPWQETRYTFDPKGRWYTCRDPACAARRFFLADAPVDPAARVLRRADPALAPLLAGASSAAEMDARVALVDSGRLAAAQVAMVARVDQQRTRRSQPEAAARRGRCQAFMLAHYSQHGRVEGAIEALMELHRSDRTAYRKITGTDRAFAYETFRGYWRTIPVEQRADAKRAYGRRGTSTP